MIVALALFAMQTQMDPPAPLHLAPIAPGPFAPTLASLKQNRYPAWFTRGKLGIWAHWGPQSVPMEGDWYARLLYQEGSNDYKDHVARFGHPSKVGYKDIIPLWKAEKWDPDHLMALYKKAGAKYFVSMGVHHDNFDLWNSTYHRWNATKMGPHRDIVGDWQKAAHKQGLHFGVSEHLGASFTWFQVSHGADKTGPLAGVPYDGANPAYADLYHQQALPGDTGWYSTDPRWHAEWYRRIKDLIDQYHPDLLYSDGGIPFGEVGQQLVAHFYNSNIALHHGKQEAVYTCKQPSGGRWAQDVERGVLSTIQTYPWQTDTSIGDWFYNKHWKYRGADWVIHTLVDVVSKNGNLLINVVQRPDGSLDPEAEKVLADMAAWMKVNGESIYDTTPWIVYGEGPIRAKGGAFKEDFAFSAKDVRYVQKGNHTVYATLMGKPGEGEIVLSSMPNKPGVTATIQGVSVLGSNGHVKWAWAADGLHVEMPPAKLSDIAVVLKITGRKLRGFPVETPALPAPQSVVSDAAGGYDLTAALAQIHGDGIQVESKNGQDNLGYWDNPDDWVSWTVDVRAPGVYEATALVSTGAGGTKVVLSVTSGTGRKRRVGIVPNTGDWSKYEELDLGRVTVSKAGTLRVSIRPVDHATWKPLNLRVLLLRKVG
ncbi:MAG: alpha-L-fucosidase [Fimbriimonadaceae bacterium]